MYTIKVTVMPPQGGAVILKPAGGTYSRGTEVTLTVEAAGKYQFVSWSGDVPHTNVTKVTITMDSNKNVTAHFTRLGW